MDPRVILLVEDHADDEALTLRALKRQRVANRVIVVRDGAEACDYPFGTGAHAGRSGAEFPALVLLDLQLPKLDGPDVLRRLRADPRTRRLPVVILTSSRYEQDLARACDGGANSYVQEPVDSERFATAVGQLGLDWLVVNAPPPPPGSP